MEHQRGQRSALWGRHPGRCRDRRWDWRATPDPNMPGHVTFYVQVPDPEATLKEIESRGGKTLMAPDEVAPGTTIALFQDPHGHMIGLTKAEE
ncbi:MAG TPA: VOC family protein [Actinomycetota bacterium]|nr:VOC family protein [Actinomycetota bacterium]